MRDYGRCMHALYSTLPFVQVEFRLSLYTDDDRFKTVHDGCPIMSTYSSFRSLADSTGVWVKQEPQLTFSVVLVSILCTSYVVNVLLLPCLVCHANLSLCVYALLFYVVVTCVCHGLSVICVCNTLGVHLVKLELLHNR